MDIDTLREDYCPHASFMLGYSPATVARYRGVIQRLKRWSGL